MSPAEPGPTSEPRPGARAKTGARLALRIMGAVIAILAAGLGVTMLVLRTNWGSERLRRQIVSRVNKEIQGSLEINRLSFGGDRVVVWGVALHDPDGQAVAQIARVEVDFSLMRVLRKEIRLTVVTIETPRLDLVSDDRGLNLSRATAPRRKAAPEPKTDKAKTDKEGWVLRLDQLDLTAGDLSSAVVSGGTRDAKVHLGGLHISASVRYATGNGSFDLTSRLGGQSHLAPVGPIRLAARVSVHGDEYRFDMDGDLLGGTLKGRGIVDRRHPELANGLIALAIPQQTLAGHDWGPVHVDAQAQPGTVPRLSVSVAIPGVELAVRDRGQPAFAAEAHLAVTNLGLAGRAVRALIGLDVPPLGGRGAIDFGVGQAPAGFGAHVKGAFESLRFGDTVISGIALSAKVREQDVSATFAVAAPAHVDVTLAGRIDDDRQGFALGSLTIAFPEERWASEGTARLRFDDAALSLESFRLLSLGQVLAIDGSKRGDNIAAHLALTGCRLGLLPTVLVDPALHLDGELDTDIKASGQMQTPKVVARLELRQARYQGFSKIDAKVGATLLDQQIEGTVSVDAPFLMANAAFKLPAEPLVPGAPIALRLDVKHVHIGGVLRGAEMEALGDGRLNLKLRLDGSADNPRLDMSLEAFDLALTRPAKVTKGTRSIDLGHAHVHVAYADRAAKGELDFASSHGGTLVVDAGARIDLSYPHVARGGLVVSTLPVHGKVVARNLDVAWLARFNQRVESLGGQVNADARLVGTVGDPEFIGDVHWKNGQVVATAPPPAAPPADPRGEQVSGRSRSAR